jgi:OOP family OmpA-OmpF porin
MKIKISLLALLTFNAIFAIAQTTIITTKTTATDSTKMPAAITTGKLFGGADQYSTWSLGANIGVTSPFLAIGGTNSTSNWKAGLGYGLSLRDRLAHAFSLQFDFHGGQVSGDNSNLPSGLKYNNQSFETNFFSGTFSGLVNVASMDFLHRANSVNFYLSAGAGLAFYHPTWVDAQGNSLSALNPDASTHYIKELVLPVGGSVKFKLSDALALNIGYTMNFIDGYNFTGSDLPVKDHYSYGYAGLEYSFGTKLRQNMDWVNPVNKMYDELYDAELRAEVDALKTRVSQVESMVNDLKKDSDGDGVADQFDKCPNTPAGTVVDGAGCPIIFPKAVDTTLWVGVNTGSSAAAAYSNIQFKFNSSAIRPTAFPALDALVGNLRQNNDNIELDGYAAGEDDATNLSLARAKSVKTYLVNAGISRNRITTKGFGDSHPIADNSTQEGLMINRRVECKLKE